MTINQLILRNIRKNIKHYYVYIFALVFSVGLYFSFVTLQFDPALDETTGTVKGASALKAGSVLLLVIVSVFLLYANNLFIKRRSKEIGLFQLIGLTKANVFRILSVENFVLYVGSLIIGIVLGFSMSRLLMLILFKVSGVEDVAAMQFSSQALNRTLLVFSAVYIVILLMNAVFIRKQSILALFRATSVTQQRVRKMTALQAAIGILGLLLIAFGYYLSSQLFSSSFLGNQLFLAMITILFSVIAGTYLFYKGSVSFIFHIIRKNKKGYLNVKDVLSLSSIMFRMKSNSFLLMIITTVSALSIALLSLSYISYYSAEKTVERSIPADFSILQEGHSDQFTKALKEKQIGYTEQSIDFLRVSVDLSNIIVSTKADENVLETDLSSTVMTVISEKDVPQLSMDAQEVFFVNEDRLLGKFVRFTAGRKVIFKGQEHNTELKFKGLSDNFVMPLRVTSAFPVAVVPDAVFNQMSADQAADTQGEFSTYTGISINQTREIEKANELFDELEISIWAGNESKFASKFQMKQSTGLTMFIVGFVGLAFLVASGCILYFKQMDESEDEKASYTTLRKLGFTTDDLVSGVRRKQLFNFGIPLIAGLSHSYFAVKSGWFFFGTEMVTPMVVVMVIYALLYSIFGILSVLSYKRVIKNAL